jgi:hypothetical protein
MFEVVAATAGTDKKAEVGPHGGQRLRDVAADESGGACYEGSQFSVLRWFIVLRSSLKRSQFSVLSSQ